MAEEVTNVASVRTPPFRISYPHLFTPHSMDGKNPKFQLTMVFPKGANFDKLNRLVIEAAKKKFGQVPKKLKWPFLDGDEMENDQNHGAVILRTNTQRKPGVVNPDRSPIYEEDQHTIISGYWAWATVNAWPWVNKYKEKGVSFSPQLIQLLPLSTVIDFYAKNDKISYDIVEETFSGSVGNAEEVFDNLVAAEDNPDEYTNTDDMEGAEEIPDFMK